MRARWQSELDYEYELEKFYYSTTDSDRPFDDLTYREQEDLRQLYGNFVQLQEAFTNPDAYYGVAR